MDINRPPAGLERGNKSADSSRRHYSQANCSAQMASSLSVTKEIALNNLLANSKIPGVIVATKDGQIVTQTFFPPEFNEDTEIQIASLTR